jgi:glycosyltransferase involved in cell wall biosynthesis
MNMSNQPLVTIIVNCFNGELFLKDSLDSILSQTYKNWEIIFWDNQSNDNSSKIFKSYNDKRFKYFLSENHTLLYEARNKAIEKSNGELISFLDVADVWLNNKLELQVPLLNNKNISLVYANCYTVNQFKYKTKLFKGNLPTGFILDELIIKYVVGLPTILIRKIFFDKIKFDENYHIIGDFDLVLRLSAVAEIDCVQSPVAIYRRHNKNLSHLNRDRHIKELKNWIEKNQKKEIFKKKNLDPIREMIKYLEIVNRLKSKKKTAAFKQILSLPLGSKKILFFIALLLPNFFLKKIVNF